MYDFPFTVEATCDVCGGGMKRIKRGTDWNSVRHYAQLHQHETHGGPKAYSTVISEAFRGAKRAFAEGAYQVNVPGDGSSPGVTLTRKD